MRSVIRPRRVIEAVLVLSILVAYLLVVTRGQIVTTLAGSTPPPTASAANHSTDSTGETIP